jgi:hypothetical protein
MGKSRFNVQRIAVPFNINFIIGFLILLFLLMQLHQLLHHVEGGIFCGKVGYLTFDRHHFSSDLSDSAYKIATFTAPLFSHYAAMWIGLFLLADKRFKLFGFSLIFASLPLARLAAVNGGDERFYGLWICQFLGIDISYATVISLIIILLIIVPPLIFAFISIGNKRRLITFLSFLLLPLIFYSIFIWYPDHRFIVPQIVESYETGKSSDLALRLYWGLPLLYIFITVTLSVLFFGKYGRYIIMGADLHKTSKLKDEV